MTPGKSATSKKSKGFSDEEKAAAKARIQELKAEAEKVPAYADKDGKVICFFQTAQKFNTRYSTFGFNDSANLDEGVMWPVAFALKELTATAEAKIAALVKKAAS